MMYAMLIVSSLSHGSLGFTHNNFGFHSCTRSLRTRCFLSTPPSTDRRQIPSLPSLPFIGSLPLIGMGKAAGIGLPPHIQMAQLALIYGDVMEVQMGREPWVVLSSPRAVHEAFVTKGKDFSGRPMVPSMGISSGGGQGFAQPKLTPELKNLRRTAFGVLFDAKQVRRSQVGLEDEAALLASHLVTESCRCGSVEIRPAIRRAVTNFVLRYAFSVRVPFSSESNLQKQDDTNISQMRLFEELVNVTDEIWSKLTSTQTTMADLLAPPDVTTNASYTLRRLVKRRDYLLREIVAQRRTQRAHHRNDGNDHTSQYDMLDALLDAGLSESEIHYTLVDLFVAGVNTVSTQIEWFVLLLAQKPTIQQRARIDVLSTDGAPYTQAVVKEVLRTKPPLLVPRKAVVDSSIGGYTVPAGTTVLANNWALTHGEKWWHKPMSFRPERWFEEESNVSGGGGDVDACKFIPYSIGRRVCPGSRLADAEMTAATQVLLRNVRWTQGKTPINLREEYSLTLAPTVSQSLCFSSTSSYK